MKAKQSSTALETTVQGKYVALAATGKRRLESTCGSCAKRSNSFRK